MIHFYIFCGCGHLLPICLQGMLKFPILLFTNVAEFFQRSFSSGTLMKKYMFRIHIKLLSTLNTQHCHLGTWDFNFMMSLPTKSLGGGSLIPSCRLFLMEERTFYFPYITVHVISISNSAVCLSGDQSMHQIVVSTLRSNTGICGAISYEYIA